MWKSTQRDGYQQLMTDVCDGEVDRVVALEVSRLSRSMRDLVTTVETIVDESDTGLHVLDMNLALEPDEDDPYQRAFLNIMGTIAQLEADMILERVRDRGRETKRETHRSATVRLRPQRRVSDAERRLRHGRRDPGADRERREQAVGRALRRRLTVGYRTDPRAGGVVSGVRSERVEHGH